MQTLLFAALLANARAHVDDDGFFAPVAGFLLGLLLFLRYDSLLGVAGVLVGLALSSLIGRRVRWSFLVTLVGVRGSRRDLHARARCARTSALPILFLGKLDAWQYLALAAAATAGVLALTLGARIPSLALRVRRVTPVLLSLVVAVAALYALFVRQPGGKLTDYDAYALRTFANFYFTGAGTARRRRRLRAGRAAGVLASAGALRRPSPSSRSRSSTRSASSPITSGWRGGSCAVILPGAMLFTCYAALAGSLTGTLRTRVLRGAIGGVFLVLLGLSYEPRQPPGPRARRVRRHHPASRAAGQDDWGQRSGDRRIEGRVRYSHPCAAAGGHLRAECPGPRIASCRTSPRLARSSTGPASVTRASSSSVAAAPTCSRAHGT